MGKQTTRTSCSKSKTPKRNITRKDVLSTTDNNDQKEKCGCGKECNKITYHIQNSENGHITINNNFFIRAKDASDKGNSVIEPIGLSGQSAKKAQPIAPQPPKIEEQGSIFKAIILILSPLFITLTKKFLRWTLCGEISQKLGISLNPEQMLLIEEKALDWALQSGILVFGSKRPILIIIFMIAAMILTRS